MLKSTTLLLIIKYVEVIIPVLIGVAYITLAERKILGAMQRRKGPNIIGIYGILQPLADGLKLFIKESILPIQSIKLYYLLAPIITLSLCLLIWIPIPISINESINEKELSILYILAISSIGVYTLLYSGWSSNSKYSILGSLRSIAQLISYEVSIGIIIMSVIILNSSFNLNIILYNQIFISNFFILFPLTFLFFLSALAETNRPPFDLPEAESELVAGYLIEYGGMTFAAIYLAEYAFILAMSSITSILFIGNLPGSISTLFFIFLFIWIRATLPRLRYDQLMSLGWTKILPFSISYLIFIVSILLTFNFTL